VSISISFEELVASASDDQEKKYDCLIIGSGYGGAVAAHTFSHCRKANGEQLKIAVLERGKEYLPGSFPAGLNEVISAITRPCADSWNMPHDGLFDIRASETHWILAGNGVGGGSLINAGVMLEPNSSTLDDEKAAWPEEARKVLNKSEHMNAVSLMLGSRLPGGASGSIANTITNAGVETSKYHSLVSLGGNENCVTSTPLSIRLSQNEPQQAVETNPCIQCGNCFSGCNFNAKKSLDTNLLAEANRNGVTIVNGAETLFFECCGHGWNVHVVYSSKKLRTTLSEPLKLYCDRLVIAAGSIGSTELLLRSQYKARRDNPDVSLFSKTLGERFYGNGDTISAITGRSQPVNMISSDATVDGARKIGPTNSGMLDFRTRLENRFILQELAVPGALQRALIELVSFSRVRDALTSLSCARSASSAGFLGLTKANVDNTMVIAGIGGDRSKGTIKEKVKEPVPAKVSATNYKHWLPDTRIEFSDDASDISWKHHRSKVLAKLRDLGSENDKGSAVVENPMEDPRGDKINELLNMSAEKSSDTKGLLMSVHPLGGCCMADSAEAGVVNVHGQVFKSEGNRADSLNKQEVYDNLAVVDGSIVPVPIDANPALSIAALALNASKKLAEKWGWEMDLASGQALEPTKRKPFREISPELRNKVHPTELTLAERLVGSVSLISADGPQTYMAELRLRSDKFSVDQFTKGESLTLELLKEREQDCAGKLPPESVLRLFRKADWDSLQVADRILDRRKQMVGDACQNQPVEDQPAKAQQAKMQWAEEQRLFFEETDAQLEELSVLTVPLSGTISVMEEVKINAMLRLCNGVAAWWLNRGLRDIRHKRSMLNKGPTDWREKLQRLWSFLKYAPSVFMHSGRERQLRYELKTGKPSKCELNVADEASLTDQPVLGCKRFFYTRHSNPINQLMAIELSDFPLLDRSQSKILNVDLEYFADVQVPLFQIHKESDAVTGYADLIALGTWFTRISLLHYFWILRKPDKPSEFPEEMRPDGRNTEPKSLPGLATDVKVFLMPVSDPNNKHNGETFIRLSRFTNGEPNEDLDPVLCIHGFSLSWSMYAHETLYGGLDDKGTDLKGGLAAYLARKGHDVWVIDLRSSGSLPTAKVDWDFEEAALIDIPAALEYISHETGKSKVNVMAHCMGAMKLSMLMMCGTNNFARYHPGYSKKLAEQYLVNTRNRIGQIVLSQAGPYVRFSPANRLRERIISVVKNIPGFDLQFEENPDAGEREEIMDRILNAMPYPEHEIRIENPRRETRFWVRGRHRMDALYGKTFSLKNMDLKVLDRFHDFFGPLSFRMLEQVIWFSRRNQISSTYGGDYKLSHDKLKQNWHQDTLWIHGEENKLLDPMSPILTTLVFDECGANNFTTKILKNFGHQDCMMGSDCEEPYRLISNHFEEGMEKKMEKSLEQESEADLEQASEQMLEKDLLVYR